MNLNLEEFDTRVETLMTLENILCSWFYCTNDVIKAKRSVLWFNIVVLLLWLTLGHNRLIWSPTSQIVLFHLKKYNSNQPILWKFLEWYKI